MEKNTNTSGPERERSLVLRNEAVRFLQTSGFDWNSDFLVFLRRQTISRVLYLASLYQMVLEVPGYILEFGRRWGPSFSVFSGLRGIYEPYNYTRGIYGFDTFEGFQGVSEHDSDEAEEGSLSSDPNHVGALNKILSLLALDSPLPNLHETNAVKGDIRETLPAWLDENPHAMIAMVIFDMDIYLPTREALDLVVPRLMGNSLLVFDEFSTKSFPGETLALLEKVAPGEFNFQRSPLAPTSAWFRWRS